MKSDEKQNKQDAKDFIRLLKLLEASGLSEIRKGTSKTPASADRRRIVTQIAQAYRRVQVNGSQETRLREIAAGNGEPVDELLLERLGRAYMLVSDRYEGDLLPEHQAVIKQYKSEDAIKASYLLKLAEGYNRHIEAQKTEPEAPAAPVAVKRPATPAPKKEKTKPIHRNNKDYWAENHKQGNPLPEALFAIIDYYKIPYSAFVSSLEQNADLFSTTLKGDLEIGKDDTKRLMQRISNGFSKVNESALEMRFLRRAFLAEAKLQQAESIDERRVAEEEAQKVIALAKRFPEWSNMFVPEKPKPASARDANLLGRKIKARPQARKASTEQKQEQLAIHLESMAACAGGLQALGLDKEDKEGLRIFNGLMDRSLWKQYGELAQQATGFSEAPKRRLAEQELLITVIINKTAASLQKMEPLPVQSKAWLPNHDRWLENLSNEEQKDVVEGQVASFNDRLELMNGEAEKNSLRGTLNSIFEAMRNPHRTSLLSGDKSWTRKF